MHAREVQFYGLLLAYDTKPIMIKISLPRLLNNPWYQTSFLLVCTVAAALALVYTHYRTRTVTINIERAYVQQQRLQDEWREINVEYTTVSLPSYIADSAKDMGLESATNETTIILPPKAIPRFVSSSSKAAQGAH